MALDYNSYITDRGAFYQEALEGIFREAYTFDHEVSLTFENLPNGQIYCKFEDHSWIISIGELIVNRIKKEVIAGFKNIRFSFYHTGGGIVSQDTPPDNSVEIARLLTAFAPCNPIAGESQNGSLVDGNTEIVNSYTQHLSRNGTVLKDNTNTLIPVHPSDFRKKPLAINGLGHFFQPLMAPYYFVKDRGDFYLLINPEARLLLVDEIDPDLFWDGTAQLRNQFKIGIEVSVDEFDEFKILDFQGEGIDRNFDGAGVVDEIIKLNGADLTNAADGTRVIEFSSQISGSLLELGLRDAFEDHIKSFFDANLDEIVTLNISRLVKEILALVNSAIDDRTLYYYFDDGGALGGFIDISHKPSLKTNVWGGGAMRSDPVTEVEYKWMGNLVLGVAIGLDIDNHQISFSDLVKDGFSLVNVPWDKGIYGHTKTKAAILYGSEVLYSKKYLRVDKRRNKPHDIDPAQPSIPEVLYRRYKKKDGFFKDFQFLNRKEQKGDDTYEVPSASWIKWLLGKTDTKKTGLPLKHGNTRKREDAGKKMGEALFLDRFYDARGLKFSATDFTNKLIREKSLHQNLMMQDNVIPDQYGIQRIVTDQEWCHLYGHGDGGSETYENFVSGSKHCNTEQLAIETGQRTGNYSGLNAKITAYLYDNETPEWPLASWMRYKIYHGEKKIFDHVYDAQNQSFNYHEFKIVETTVRRCVAEGVQNNSTEKAFDEYGRYITLRFVKEIKALIADNADEKLRRIREILSIDDLSTAVYAKNEGMIKNVAAYMDNEQPYEDYWL
ncbi:MAG: hypothetical protein JXR03_13095 [Cyclobacteriaceae bacterium]